MARKTTIVKEKRQRKRGSYREKHRGHVSRWLQCVLAYKRRKRPTRTAMYESVEECIKMEKRR